MYFIVAIRTLLHTCVCRIFMHYWRWYIYSIATIYAVYSPCLLGSQISISDTLLEEPADNASRSIWCVYSSWPVYLLTMYNVSVNAWPKYTNTVTTACTLYVCIYACTCTCTSSIEPTQEIILHWVHRKLSKITLVGIWTWRNRHKGKWIQIHMCRCVYMYTIMWGLNTLYSLYLTVILTVYSSIHHDSMENKQSEFLIATV